MPVDASPRLRGNLRDVGSGGSTSHFHTLTRVLPRVLPMTAVAVSGESLVRSQLAVAFPRRRPGPCA